MSTLQQKMNKQFEYQRTLFNTSTNPMDLFVSVDDLTTYLAEQTRADQNYVRRKVKSELEYRAEAG